MLVFTNNDSAAITLACSETLAGANNAWAAAAFYGGDASGIRGLRAAQRAPNAQEVTIGNMHFVFPFSVLAVLVQVRNSTGAAKAWVA